MAAPEYKSSSVGEQSSIYDSYLPDSELEGEEVKYQMKAKHSPFDDYGGGNFLYTLGRLTISTERAVFVSPRQVIDTELSAIVSVRHRKDKINRFMLAGGILLILGLISGFVTEVFGIGLILISLILLAFGAFIRGEELVLSTAGDDYRFRTIRTKEGLEAAAAIREQQHSR